MNDIDTIKPGFGLGKLTFGSPLEICRTYLGNPEDEVAEDVGNKATLTWYYWNKGISLHFDEADDFRLGTISIARESASLFGDTLIGKSYEEIKAYLKEKGFRHTKEFEFEDEDRALRKLIEIEDIECNFWFENGVLNHIQWGYFWIDDYTPKWPNSVKI